MSGGEQQVNEEKEKELLTNYANAEVKKLTNRLSIKKSDNTVVHSGSMPVAKTKGFRPNANKMHGRDQHKHLTEASVDLVKSMPDTWFGELGTTMKRDVWLNADGGFDTEFMFKLLIEYFKSNRGQIGFLLECMNKQQRKLFVELNPELCIQIARKSSELALNSSNLLSI